MYAQRDPVRVEVRDLGKSYGKKQVLRDISFDLEPGRITGLVGPNGSGKSTMMRLMLGLDLGTGSTLYDGQPLTEFPVAASVVGAHLGTNDFQPKRTARSHLRMLAPVAGVEDARADELLEQFGLDSVARSKIGGFSLGMAQRLGLASALLGQPRVLLLDEPANGLDPQSTRWLRDFLRDFRDRGNSVLLSSHLLRDLQDLADDLVVIGRGEMITSQPLGELLQEEPVALLRVGSVDSMATALTTANAKFETEADGHIRVTGMTCEQVSELAFVNGIRLLELRPVSLGLEDVVDELTRDRQEFGIPSSTNSMTKEKESVR